MSSCQLLVAQQCRLSWSEALSLLLAECPMELGKSQTSCGVLQTFSWAQSSGHSLCFSRSWVCCCSARPSPSSRMGRGGQKAVVLLDPHPFACKGSCPPTLLCHRSSSFDKRQVRSRPSECLPLLHGCCSRTSRPLGFAAAAFCSTSVRLHQCRPADTHFAGSSLLVVIAHVPLFAARQAWSRGHWCSAWVW